MKVIKEQFRELFPEDMRKYNHWGKRKKRMHHQIVFLVSPNIKKGIDIIINSGKFANQSEFMRHLIVNYFDKVIFND